MSPGSSHQKTVRQQINGEHMVEIPLNDVNGGDNISSISSEPHHRRCCKNNAGTCNIYRQKIRKKIHCSFFRFGRCVQKNYLFFLIVCGVILLGLPCIKIKYVTFETDIRKMWTVSEGALKEEMEYTREQVNAKGFGEEGIVHETLIQVVKSDDENILKIDMIEEHRSMLQSIINLKLTAYNNDWYLSDFCAKFDVPSYFGANQMMAGMISAMSPCLIMTPLDCFYEGSFIASPLPSAMFDYRTNSPKKLLDILDSKDKFYKEISEKIVKFFDEAGVENAYIHKPKLWSASCAVTKDNSSDCPLKEKDIGAILTGGCYGVARNYMHWPEELIVSGVTKNSSLYINRAKALQSVISIKSVSDFYNSVEVTKTTNIPNFSIQIAADIMNKWRSKFTAEVDKLSKQVKLKTKMVAFSTSSFERMLDKYLAVDCNKIMINFALMILYAVFALKRYTHAIYSYGFVGCTAVVLVCVSVILGLAISDIKLSTATLQVLPFLALGLGVNNMFLLIRTYMYICDSGKIKDKDIVGLCLGECGLSITATSFANICAFLMASLIPIITIKEFAQQAAIIVAVNWYCLFFVFTSFLAIDVQRQKGKNYDIVCCFKEEDEEESINIPSILQDIHTQQQQQQQQQNIHVQVGATSNTPAISAMFPVDLFSYANSHRQNIMQNNSQNRNNISQNRKNNLPNRKDKGTLPNHFQASKSAQATQSRRCQTPQLQRKTLDGNNQSNKFEIARSKRYYNVDPKKDIKQPPDEEKREPCWKTVLNKLSLTYFVLNYFGKWIIKPQVKIAVLTMLCSQLALAGYGTTLVENDLDIAEMIPKDLPQHMYMIYRQKYFSYYKIYIATRDLKNNTMFDYANNQQLLVDFYRELAKVKNVIPSRKKVPKFWLFLYREWMKDAEKKLREEWNVTISHKCVPNCTNASEEAKLAYRLLRTLNQKQLIDDYAQIFSEHLVDEKDIINPQLFYHGLSVWYYNDYLGVVDSNVLLRPKPIRPIIQHINYIDEPFIASPKLMLIPFEVRNMTATKNIVEMIKSVRGICKDFGLKGLPSYPIGIPFTYWEQFINLEQYLFMSLAVVLTSIFFFLLLTSMSVKAALIVVFFLGITFFELFGFIGLLGIKLSAIPVIVSIISIGISIEFTVHTVIAYLNTPGSRNDRTRGALEITFASMIDTTISSLIVLALLSSSPFDYVVKYFFQLMLCLVFTSAGNGIFVLPVFLTFCGPCAEGGTIAITPSAIPACNIPSSKLKRRNIQRGENLSVIAEESDSSNSRNQIDKKSFRPSTPCNTTSFIDRSDTSYCCPESSDVILEEYDNELEEQLQHTSSDREVSYQPSVHSISSSSMKSDKSTVIGSNKRNSPHRCRNNETLREHTNSCCSSEHNSRTQNARNSCNSHSNCRSSTRAPTRCSCRNSASSTRSLQRQPQIIRVDSLPSQKLKANVSIEFESHPFMARMCDHGNTYIEYGNGLTNID